MDFTTPPPNMEPVAIYNDGGGLVDKYRIAAFQYRLEGRQVKILGSCRSACVLALSVPNVCVGPNAVVKAHHAYEQRTGIIRADVTESMMRELPENIRREIQPNISRQYNEAATLDYKELLALGIPDCNNTAPKNKEMITVRSHKVKSVRIVAQTKPTNPVGQFFNMIRSKFNGTP